RRRFAAHRAGWTEDHARAGQGNHSGPRGRNRGRKPRRKPGQHVLDQIADHEERLTMLFKRLKILYWQNQFWFIVVLACLILGVLSVVGLYFMDSFFAQQQIATLPLETLKMMLWGITSAYFFMQIMYKGGGGLSALRAGRIKGESVKVTFKDVIGLNDA